MADYEFPLQAIQLGSNLAQQGFNRDLQRRQLAGQEADRALRARVTAQEMELNALKIDELSDKVAMEAKRRAMLEAALDGFTKEMSVINPTQPTPATEASPAAESSPDFTARFPLDTGIGLALSAPRGPGPAPMMIPERLQGALGVEDSPLGAVSASTPAPRPEIGEAFLKHFGPVAALTGSNLDNVIRAATTLERQRGEGALLRQKTEADIKRIQSVTKLNETRAANVGKSPEFAPTPAQKNYAALKRAEAEGDAQGVQIFSEALKLGALDEIDRIRFRAEMDAIENNILLSLDPEKQKAAFDAVEEKYRTKRASGAKASTPVKMRWEPGKGLVK